MYVVFNTERLLNLGIFVGFHKEVYPKVSYNLYYFDLPWG